MTLLRTLCCAILLVIAATAVAEAQCKISLARVADVRFRGANAYDVFRTSETAITATFEVRHKKGVACDYFVGFSPGGAGVYDRTLTGPDSLHYQIYDTPSKANVLKTVPGALESEVLAGAFGTDAATAEFSYYVSIPAGQVVPNGDYIDNITVTLYEGTLSSYTQRDSAAFKVRAPIDKVIQMCVVGCGAPFDPFAKSRTLNFGQLRTGDSRELDLLVRGNINYDVFLSSDNRGNLTHMTDKKSQVPYSLAIDGVAVDLSPNRILAISGVGPTGADGDRYHVTAVIGPTTGSIAGDHRDVVQITVRSQ